jgi:hypothetical protein
MFHWPNPGIRGGSVFVSCCGVHFCSARRISQQTPCAWMWMMGWYLGVGSCCFRRRVIWGFLTSTGTGILEKLLLLCLYDRCDTNEMPSNSCVTSANGSCRVPHVPRVLLPVLFLHATLYVWNLGELPALADSHPSPQLTRRSRKHRGVRGFIFVEGIALSVVRWVIVGRSAFHHNSICSV